MVTSTVNRRYPRQARLADSGEVTLRLMSRNDRQALLNFARHLPGDDLLFLRMDITSEGAIDEWITNVEAGRTITVLAEKNGELAGYASLHYNEVLWTRHVGEIRVVVAPKHRRKALGQRLTEEVFAISRGLGLRKVMAQMTPDQVGARATFERLGFRPEALLADFVVDRSGKLRDMLIMSYDVDGFHDSVEN